MGFKVVRLTTGEKQPEAMALYVKIGFQIVTSWETNPPDGFDYFEIRLDLDTVTVAGYGAAEVLRV